MGDNITPDVTDRNGSLVRQRCLTEGEAAVWTTLPGFQYAIAKDLIKNGKVYKTLYEIFGEGVPSTGYDNATPGSTYTDTTNGWSFRRILGDSGTSQWMHQIVGGRTAGTDSTEHTTGGQGSVILVTDGGVVYLKSEETTTDEDVELQA